jgi:hypothetical protein
MAYELIPGEMYVVCIEFDISGVMCDWIDYNINKRLPRFCDCMVDGRTKQRLNA